MSQYDLVIIGSGPGGYVCAIKAAQLGLKAAIVEKRATFGGTCLNIGCIPSKALLYASEMFSESKHQFKNLGIDVATPQLNLKQMMAHKDTTVQANVEGIAYLFKKNKIDTFHGTGRILSANQVEVIANDGSANIVEAKNIVIATGSDVAGLPGIDIEFDEKVIVSSTGALKLENVPQHMVVVGGGVIGLELGSVWSRLGAKVTIIEFLDQLLGAMDKEVSKQFERISKKQGLDIQLSTKVTGIESTDYGAKVTYEPVSGGAPSSVDTNVVLVSTGRRPYIEGLGLEEMGIELDPQNRIVTDAHFKTNINGIYAIGDVIAGPMLAHKAEDEGIALAEILAGQAGHVNYAVIPSVVYTTPEVASVGQTEEELKSAGQAYKIGKFPFTANGRARAMLASDGFVKVLADANTDRVLGVHILGHNAGELIHEAAVLMEFGGASEDLARICHAHPTLSEAVHEAALATFAQPIHI